MVRLLVRPKAAFHVVAPSLLEVLSESGIEAGELFVAQTQERVIWEFCELQFAATDMDGWLRQSGFVKQCDPAYAGCYELGRGRLSRFEPPSGRGLPRGFQTV